MVMPSCIISFILIVGLGVIIITGISFTVNFALVIIIITTDTSISAKIPNINHNVFFLSVEAFKVWWGNALNLNSVCSLGFKCILLFSFNPILIAFRPYVSVRRYDSIPSFFEKIQFY